MAKRRVQKESITGNILETSITTKYTFLKIPPEYYFCHQDNMSGKFNRIGGVIISVLSSSEVDRVFEPPSGYAKDFKMSICCFSANETPIETGDELRCFGRASSSCSTSDTRHVQNWSELRCFGRVSSSCSTINTRRVTHVTIPVYEL
jgi:hypothetical protein